MYKFLFTFFTVLAFVGCMSTNSNDSCSVGTPLTPTLTITNNSNIHFYYHFENLLSSWPIYLDTVVTIHSLPRQSNFNFKVATLWGANPIRDSTTFSTMDYNIYSISIDQSVSDSVEFNVTYKEKYCK